MATHVDFEASRSSETIHLALVESARTSGRITQVSELGRGKHSPDPKAIALGPADGDQLMLSVRKELSFEEIPRMNDLMSHVGAMELRMVILDF
jgi:hypothetical protein